MSTGALRLARYWHRSPLRRERRRTISRGLLFVGLAATLSAAEIRAQEKVEGMAGAAILIAVPMGEFKNFVDPSPGLSLHLFGPGGVFGLRFDGSIIHYGIETVHRLAPDQLITVGEFIDDPLDVTTENLIGSLIIGPQLSAPLGALRPYLNAGIGFSLFYTKSSVNGTSDVGDFGSTLNFVDFTLAAAAGGGLLIRLSKTVFLDLSGRYMRNGQVRYLREGSIKEAPDGSISFIPIESETNMWLIQVGVSIASGKDEEDESGTP